MAASKNKNKFYAVAAGRKAGIFRSWYGPGEAEEQVRGVPNARFQGFPSYAEAEKWLQQQREEAESRPGGQEGPGDAVPASPASAERANRPTGGGGCGEGRPPPDGTVVIYTDGGAIGNPGPGGYGAVLLSGDRRTEISGGFRRTTNNRMELMACIAALGSLKQPSSVELFSDSEYVVNAIRKGWARRWKAAGWTRREDGTDRPNADLWQRLLGLLDRHHVTFRWVRGHAGNRENERCDKLAVAAARRPDLPEDVGYRATTARRWW